MNESLLRQICMVLVNADTNQNRLRLLRSWAMSPVAKTNGYYRSTPGNRHHQLVINDGKFAAERDEEA
jgi:hypothetical protein